MSTIGTALTRIRGISNTAHAVGLRLKAGAGGGLLDISPMGGMDQLSQFQQQGANRQRYSTFRGWPHAAINALASAAASQPVSVGRLKNSGRPTDKKIIELLPASIRLKAATSELRIDPKHELVDSLENCNPIQSRWQFVYTCVANLCVTGWSFVIAGETEDGYEFYSLPTTWIEPNHEEGPFSRFRIRNPLNPSGAAVAGADGDGWLRRDQVGLSFLPNPADPMAALALIQAQAQAVRIDDQIQSSQALFFENGLFPSMIVRVGKQPHPDVPGGMAPRLTGVQRRQVYAAIKKVMGGVANYGNPAILDGLIDGIERLSATQNEMGWEKSERAVRTRILSSFGVHPYILGEEMAGSYAQAYNVQDLFCRRVNIFLSLITGMMTGLCRNLTGERDLEVWWQEAAAKDPSMERGLWEGARGRGDVSQNEFRAWMGLPPDVDGEQAQIDKSALTGISKIAADATAGAITPEQATAILQGMGLEPKLAKKIAGTGPKEPPAGATAAGMSALPGTPGEVMPAAVPSEEEEDDDDEDVIDRAAAALEKACSILTFDPAVAADRLLAGIQ